MTGQDVYRVPAVRLVERAAEVATCPVCQEGTFQAIRLKTTVLLACSAGCTGRRIAVALGLDGWPEVLS